MAEKEKEQKTDEEMDMVFTQFISGLYTSTMQHLGKLMNPFTGQVDRNLDAAKHTIELVRMLKEKTKGNLTTKESDTLNNALSNMQMNYVDELERQERSPGKSAEEESKPEEEKQKKPSEEKPEDKKD